MKKSNFLKKNHPIEEQWHPLVSVATSSSDADDDELDPTWKVEWIGGNRKVYNPTQRNALSVGWLLTFLSDPGVPGVRSMGPVLCN